MMLSRAEREIGQLLADHCDDQFEGMVLLTTCNRFEVYLDANTFHGAVGLVLAAITKAVPEISSQLLDSFYSHSGPGVIEHLFRVAAGLESMVVGEPEIVGQVRTALAAANGQLSSKLRRAFEGALATSKAISTQTELRQVGSSLAAVGLDLAQDTLPPWSATRALILGTGQYAGTVVAELSRRNCSQMAVYSATGMAEAFAATHPVTPVSDLATTLTQADLLVAASGHGQAKVDANALNNAATKVVLDLSGGADLTGELAVPVIGLAEIGEHTPPACRESVAKAEEMLNSAVAGFLQDELGRGAAPAVTAMRSYIKKIIDDEVARAKAEYPPEVAQAVEKALHRATGAMLHHPSITAVELARIGRLNEYSNALNTIFGILVEA